MDENPANDPTRVWRDDSETLVEAILLTQRLDATPRALLRTLAQQPGRPFSAADLADGLANCGSEQVQSAVERINKFSDAFGFVTLAEETPYGYLVASEPATVILKALELTEAK